MTTVERIKNLCKERKIPISRLEQELGFGNAYFRGLKKGTVPSDRLQAVSEYLGVSKEYLISGTENNFSDINAYLVSQIRNDDDLSATLPLYFSLNPKQKNHILELIQLLAED